MITKNKILTSLAILLASTSASAELISSDWLAGGDNRVVLDTETGIEWLDMSETRGMDISDLIDNSVFDGWSVGGEQEVISFMNSIISDGTFRDFNSMTHNGNSFNSYSLYLRDAGNYAMAGFVLDGRSYLNYGSYTDSNNRSDFGIWLKSDGGLTISSINDPGINANNANAPAGVPIGASISLLALGLAGFSRRKKK